MTDTEEITYLTSLKEQALKDAQVFFTSKRYSEVAIADAHASAYAQQIDLLKRRASLQ